MARKRINTGLEYVCKYRSDLGMCLAKRVNNGITDVKREEPKRKAQLPEFNSSFFNDFESWKKTVASTRAS